MKRLLVVVCAVAALCGTGLIATNAAEPDKANAGSCTRDNDTTERHIVDDTVSISMEAGTYSGGTYVTVCYSDTPTSDPRSTIAGGFVHVRVDPATGQVFIWCVSDPAMVTVSCFDAPHHKQVGTNGLCLLKTGSTCIASVPAPYVYTGTAAGPALTVTVLGVPVDLNFSDTCVGYCP